MIVLFDGVDWLVRYGDNNDTPSTSHALRTIFVQELEVLRLTSTAGVYVVGVTCNPWMMDDTFVQLFQIRVHVQYPKYFERFHLLKLALRDKRHGIKETELRAFSDKCNRIGYWRILEFVNEAFNQVRSPTLSLSPHRLTKVLGTVPTQTFFSTLHQHPHQHPQQHETRVRASRHPFSQDYCGQDSSRLRR